MPLKAKVKVSYPSWDSKEGADVRLKRDQLLDTYRWTIQEDSPLSNKEDFLDYLKTLHRITVDYDSPALVEFPELPAYVYKEII